MSPSSYFIWAVGYYFLYSGNEDLLQLIGKKKSVSKPKIFPDTIDYLKIKVANRAHLTDFLL